MRIGRHAVVCARAHRRSARPACGRPPPWASRSQLSTPFAVTRWTVLASPPITSPETSLATIQSAPLRARLAVACSTTSLGFGGEADQQRGRLRAARRASARMSGFSASASAGGAAALLDLLRRRPRRASRRPRRPSPRHRRAARRRPPSAISRAVSTSMRSTPGGVASATGPATSVTRAPSAASAAAIAKPCLPDERLAM